MSRQLLEEAFIFNPVPHVSRAIFISSPHRGSELASNWIGRLSSRLVRPPALLADIRDSEINVLTIDDAALQLNRVGNSIDTLAPNNRFVLATKDLPFANEVPYHSIMGNRGKPGPKDESSDGVGWSARHSPGNGSGSADLLAVLRRAIFNHRQREDFPEPPAP
jgi:hypothetical protein